MATQKLQVTPLDGSLDARVETIRQREIALSRMVMLYIGTGLLFMLLPGTFLGVWNLISISGKHAANSISPAWMQAHGQAQVFGWVGTFILGIGFYSIPKMRRAQAFAMWEAWICWAMWTFGVLSRWVATVYDWHWRVALPVSAAFQLLAFALFFKTVASHRPAAKGEERPKLDRWILVVIAGTIGLLATLTANLIGSVEAALHSSSPAFAAAFNQRFLVLMTWGFMVPFVWGFSARWLSTFVGLSTMCDRGLMLMVAVNTAGVLAAMFSFTRAAVVLFLVACVMSLVAIRVIFRSRQPAKILGVHVSFPYFVRLAYAWLIVSAALGIWAAFARYPEGIWGASRHALTVGFVATMIFAIGSRILPAFSGMRVLYSPNLMGLSLAALTVGCFLRVTSEILAYQEIAQFAWKWLTISAVLELTAVTLFAGNLAATFLSKPPSQLVRLK